MNLWEKNIYPVLPVWIQNIGISAYGLYWYHRRFGGIFQEELKKFKDRENFTSQQWRDYQTVELRKLLCHAFETVPYYREKYGHLGFRLSDFQKFELEDLKKLPYLEKEDFRKYGTTTLISSKREKGGQFFSSSGSTGTPTKILFSHSFHQRWSAAFEARIRHWAAVDRFHTRGMIGGRRIVQKAKSKPPFYRYNLFEKQVYFSAYHISKSTISSYLEGMNRHQIRYMTGYAMSNFFVANILDQMGLTAPRLNAVITSSEKLTSSMRKVIEKVFQCKSFDSYSGVEGCGLISETKHGDLLISPDVGIMEIVDDSGLDVEPGKSGEVVSTGLLNYDQPLIRYRIGDRVRLSKFQASKLGHEMPVVDEIEGRVEDKVVGKDGRVMVRFHGLFIDIPNLVAAQIVQTDYDDFTFNLIVETGFNHKHKEIIKKRLESQIGRCNVTFNMMDELPKNKNGKFQAVISKLAIS